MSSKKPSSIARLLGSGLAHVQNALDDVADWGFRKMKEAGEKQQKVIDPEESTYVSVAKRVGKGTLRFLGTVGDSFYEKYNTLKQKKK